MKQRILIEMDYESHETDEKMKELEALGYHVHSANLTYIVLDPNTKVSIIGSSPDRIKVDEPSPVDPPTKEK